MRFITSSDYEEQMKEIVLPELAKARQSGTFERIPGQKLYYESYTAENPKATVVMVHGFTEGIGKFYESVWYFLQNGYNIWLLQQREHGLSYRSTDDPALIYLTDFRDLIEDLHTFTHDIVKKAPGTASLPLYLYGHSMGGGVSACYLEKYPDDYEKAVLTSPMLEMDSGGVPVGVAEFMARLMILFGKGKNYMPGSKPFSPVEDFENSCCNCLERFHWWFEQQKTHVELQMCVPSFQTVLEFLKLTKYATAPANTNRVKAKVLLFQAGHDNMVKPGGQDRFISQIGSKGRLIRMENARHEIYMGQDEDLKEYWPEIFSFYQK